MEIWVEGEEGVGGEEVGEAEGGSGEHGSRRRRHGFRHGILDKKGGLDVRHSLVGGQLSQPGAWGRACLLVHVCLCARACAWVCE